MWRTAHDFASKLAAAWRELAFFDAARGQPSWQSSYRRAENARGLSSDGARPNGRFCATDLEDAPWWLVDLGRDWPVHAIRIFNRTDKYAIRSARLVVSISSDKRAWQVIHSGTHYFGGNISPAPLEIHLLGHHAARYVRLELPQRGILSVRRLQVLVRRKHRQERAPGHGLLDDVADRLRAAAHRWRTRRAALAAHVPELLGVEAQWRPDTAAAVAPGRAKVADLGRELPIYLVRIRWRGEAGSDAASRITVALSRDGATWDSVLSGVHVFGDYGVPGPLEIRLCSISLARFVRLELPDPMALALVHAEILVEPYLIDLHAVCEQYAFDYAAMLPSQGAIGRSKYVVLHVPRPFDGTVDAFHISHAVGRFGNHLKALMIVTCLARRLGIGKVYLTELSEFDVDEPLEADGIIVRPDRMLAGDKAGPVLSGRFFMQTPFKRHLKQMTEEEEDWAVRHVARPLFQRRMQKPPYVPEDTDLSIHIRSGDLFSNPRPHTGYVQPPLAYYQLILRFAQRELGIRRVIIGFEDDLNPCIGALQHWLNEIGVPFITQSASLQEDLSVQVNARHCVYGHGSFGPAIIRLSQRMQTVFMPWTMVGSVRIARIAGVRPILAQDVAGEYIRAGNWHGTPEQRRMMLDYPIENLALDLDPKLIKDPSDFAGGYGG